MSRPFNAQVLQDRLATALPGADIAVRDLTGTGDHFAVEVISALFAGLGQIARHRKVYSAVADVIGGALHALALQTLTPEEASARAGTPGAP